MKTDLQRKIAGKAMCFMVEMSNSDTEAGKRNTEPEFHSEIHHVDPDGLCAIVDWGKYWIQR